jgi:hypothetical protein
MARSGDTEGSRQPYNLRRDIMKVMIASSAATVFTNFWGSTTTPVLAYTETKEDLVAQANLITKVEATSVPTNIYFSSFWRKSQIISAHPGEKTRI